eukprot:CAMPEP_0117756438 /NCGR_PEP_ID=MMETSP0947-20121206/14079_1 /TAXON_ID=44440 /ORGANISM="Chattonella subsalsa, Strain CCMP2191" /LENGTH=345 /DNA_ID=CAMNT_0005576027 /DNA_START=16 /DNA_END=1050 /DNA_ORIENTATION=-
MAEKELPKTATYATGNLPQSNNTFINNRAQKLHYRCYFPDSKKKVKAVVFYFHGHGSHINNPASVKFGEDLAQIGNLAVFMLDMVGHGYSEGERAYIEDYTYLVSDGLDFVRFIRSGKYTEQFSQGAASDSVQYASDVQKAKWFISGMSLGGAVCLLMGLSLTCPSDSPVEDEERQDSSKAELDNWGGAILLAPAIRANPPSRTVIFVFQYFLLPLFPKQCLPSFIYPNRGPELTWRSEAEQQRSILDSWGSPGGLRWGHNMRLATAYSLMQMLETVQTKLSRVNFPFLALHDPNDMIVQIEATKELVTQCQTTPSDVRFIEVENGLHDLICNEPDTCVRHIVDW